MPRKKQQETNQTPKKDKGLTRAEKSILTNSLSSQLADLSNTTSLLNDPKKKPPLKSKYVPSALSHRVSSEGSAVSAEAQALSDDFKNAKGPREYNEETKALLRKRLLKRNLKGIVIPKEEPSNQLDNSEHVNIENEDHLTTVKGKEKLDAPNFEGEGKGKEKVQGRDEDVEIEDHLTRAKGKEKLDAPNFEDKGNEKVKDSDEDARASSVTTKNTRGAFNLVLNETVETIEHLKIELIQNATELNNIQTFLRSPHLKQAAYYKNPHLLREVIAEAKTAKEKLRTIQVQRKFLRATLRLALLKQAEYRAHIKALDGEEKLARLPQEEETITISQLANDRAMAKADLAISHEEEKKNYLLKEREKLEQKRLAALDEIEASEEDTETSHFSHEQISFTFKAKFKQRLNSIRRSITRLREEASNTRVEAKRLEDQLQTKMAEQERDSNEAEQNTFPHEEEKSLINLIAVKNNLAIKLEEQAELHADEITLLEQAQPASLENPTEHGQLAEATDDDQGTSTPSSTHQAHAKQVKKRIQQQEALKLAQIIKTRELKTEILRRKAAALAYTVERLGAEREVKLAEIELKKLEEKFAKQAANKLEMEAIDRLSSIRYSASLQATTIQQTLEKRESEKQKAKEARNIQAQNRQAATETKASMSAAVKEAVSASDASHQAFMNSVKNTYNSTNVHLRTKKSLSWFDYLFRAKQKPWVIAQYSNQENVILKEKISSEEAKLNEQIKLKMAKDLSEDQKSLLWDHIKSARHEEVDQPFETAKGYSDQASASLDVASSAWSNFNNIPLMEQKWKNISDVVFHAVVNFQQKLPPWMGVMSTAFFLPLHAISIVHNLGVSKETRINRGINILTTLGYISLSASYFTCAILAFSLASPFLMTAGAGIGFVKSLWTVSSALLNRYGRFGKLYEGAGQRDQQKIDKKSAKMQSKLYEQYRGIIAIKADPNLTDAQKTRQINKLRFNPELMLKIKKLTALKEDQRKRDVRIARNVHGLVQTTLAVVATALIFVPGAQPAAIVGLGVLTLYGGLDALNLNPFVRGFKAINRLSEKYRGKPLIKEPFKQKNEEDLVISICPELRTVAKNLLSATPPKSVKQKIREIDEEVENPELIKLKATPILKLKHSSSLIQAELSKKADTTDTAPAPVPAPEEATDVNCSSTLPRNKSDIELAIDQVKIVVQANDAKPLIEIPAAPQPLLPANLIVRNHNGFKREPIHSLFPQANADRVTPGAKALVSAQERANQPRVKPSLPLAYIGELPPPLAPIEEANEETNIFTPSNRGFSTQTSQ